MSRSLGWIGTLVLAVGGLAGCVSKDTAKPVPAAAREAAAACAEGRAAFHEGDFAAAQQHFLRAVRLQRSVDNEEGVARHLVNLAVTQEAAGEAAAARESLAALDRFIALRRQALPEAGESQALLETLAEARLLEVRLLIAGGRLAEAEAMLPFDSKLPLTDRTACARSRLRLAQGRNEEALQEAERAWSGARRAKDAVTAAAAARLAARAAEGLGRYEEALSWHQRALELEGQAARPRQVAEAWQGVARCARALGRLDQATAAEMKARDVLEAAEPG